MGVLQLLEIQELSPFNKLENKNYEEITVYASELQNLYYKLKSAINILREYENSRYAKPPRNRNAHATVNSELTVAALKNRIASAEYENAPSNRYAR